MFKTVKLAHLPTPIETLPGLTRYFGGPELIIKRDDLTGLGVGGNKTRKLEYLVGDAIEKGCDMLISTGAVQSNHCRQVAAASAKLGLECRLVLAGDEPEEPQGNYLLDKLSGAKVQFVRRFERDLRLQDAFKAAEAEGRKPYLIPYGGSSAVGALGYVQAMHELKEQGADPDWIVFATSSGGTQAGMVLGAHQTGLKAKLLGIGIDKLNINFPSTIANLVNETAKLVGDPWRVTADEIIVNTEFDAPGYGVLQPHEVDAVKLFARKDGINLDPVYTGRAAGGMVDLLKRGYFKKGEQILFWHTGGIPALFAEPYQAMMGK